MGVKEHTRCSVVHIPPSGCFWGEALAPVRVRDVTRGDAMSRILVIDDELEVRDLVTRILESANHQVVTAADGVEALARYEAGASTDLIITDIIMPEKEGLETILDLLRRNPEARIVAMSGGGRITPEDHLQTAELMGARASIAKPFTRGELLEVVESVLA